MVDDDFTGDPDNIADGRVVVAPINFDEFRWDQAQAQADKITHSGWVMVASPIVLISVGRFLTLLTLAEQAAIHVAAKTDPVVEALLFMLQGFTQGISLADQTLATLLQVMVAKGLLAADRVAQILAGQVPV